MLPQTSQKIKEYKEIISKNATRQHYNRRRELVKQYETLFNITCLIPKPVRENSLWECNVCGQGIETSINTLKTRVLRNSDKHNICQRCHDEKYMSIAKEIANKNNWKILSSKISGLTDFVEWECNKGHKWKQTLSRSKKHGCRQCSTGEFVTFEKCKQVYLENNLELLEDKYLGWLEKHKARCITCGHLYYPRFCSVRKKHGCPQCYSNNYGKLDGKNDTDYFFGYIRKLFPTLKRGFPIGEYFVDYYLPDLNVVVEYDEAHHYSYGQLRERDIIRQRKIERLLQCKFVRVKDEVFMKDNNFYTEMLQSL